MVILRISYPLFKLLLTKWLPVFTWIMLMKITCLNNNVVVIFSQNIAALIKTENVELKIASIFSDKSPKPVVTKFVDQTAILIPEIQQALFVAGNSLIVSDQTIGDFAKKDTLKLLQLLRGVIDESVPRVSAISFGYNFIYDLENGDFDGLAKTLASKFFKEETGMKLPPDTTLEHALPMLIIKHSDAKITLKFDTVTNDQRTAKEDRIRISANVHFSSSEFPDLESLSKSYSHFEKLISNYLSSIWITQ